MRIASRDASLCGWLLVLLACGTSCGPSPQTPSAPGITTNAPAASVQPTAPDYAKLVGRWQRTDAEYVIEVRSADNASGRVDAAYLNPAPIHVSRAEASTETGKLKLFVELQDVGYPGSTYRLTYFAQTDQLFGVYYQAALDQSFDVEFERQR